ncbi:DUF4276 family protein [Burkholderia contaminans]|uniref:DUF4276 family protein n=1 Tax=Burkholderia contaminans TaxID=488447 RepID=UPI0018DD495A|nr:DUF4276 family protein [Burkholderia contaminans]
MYILITEDQTDFDAIKIIIRRIAGQPKLSVKGKGLGGAGEIKNKGTAIITSLVSDETKGCIVVRDCDGLDSEGKFKSIKADVFDKVKFKQKPPYCIVLPKHELESWYLADIGCVTRVWPQWHPNGKYNHPETIKNAKEELIRISRINNLRPRYSTSDGVSIANVMDLEIVRRKCPSFEPLHALITKSEGNV